MEDILSQVNALKETNAQLGADHKAATELLESVNAELTTFKAEAVTKDNLLAEQAKVIDTLKGNFEASSKELASVKALVTTLEAKEATAEQKAVAMVASQGVAPMPVKAGASEAVTKAQATEHYQSLLAKGEAVEAGKYFNAHKTIIIK